MRPIKCLRERLSALQLSLGLDTCSKSNPPARALDHLIKSCSQAVWMADAQGRIVEDSPTWRTFTGQTLEDWTANKWLDVVHPKDRARASEVWSHAVAHGKRYETNYRLWHVSLGWRWTRARGIPILSAKGEIEGWLGLNDDITEEVLGREKLRQSQEQFRVLADLIPALIWAADEQAQVYFWNQAWYTYTGATESESLGLGAADFIRPDLRELTLQTWSEAVFEKSRFEMEVPVKRADGEYRWFLAKAHPIPDESGVVLRWVGSMVDIHAQRETIDHLQTQRAAREQYVLSLTHDLRNALWAGQSSFDLLRSEPDLDDKVRFEKIVDNSFRRTERMVRDLLDANRLESGQVFTLKAKTRASLKEFIKGVCLGFEARESCVKLTHCEDARVFWDLNEMTRVLDNLIDNAKKYRSGGDVSVAVRVVEDHVELSVHNWGHPICEDDRKRLFELFERAETARDSQPGWGIGLTLVNGVVEAHGGSVSVQCGPETGTTFTCRIPVEEDDVKVVSREGKIDASRPLTVH